MPANDDERATWSYVEPERVIEIAERVALDSARLPEVVGTIGQLPKGAITLVESAQAVVSLEVEDPTNLAFITQTTLSLDDTKDIAEGPRLSAYKVLESMMDKMTAQMELGRKIRAVDEADVGAKVIGTHFLPDLMGNLKAFSKQKVRCVQCNAKYRRMPLKGACLKCGNPKITLTVHEGSVRKYLNISKEVAEKYNIDAYTKQRIMLLEQAVESLFNNDKVRKAKLDDFF